MVMVVSFRFRMKREGEAMAVLPRAAAAFGFNAHFHRITGDGLDPAHGVHGHSSGRMLDDIAFEQRLAFGPGAAPTAVTDRG
jgi:hypothetical protein